MARFWDGPLLGWPGESLLALGWPAFGPRSGTGVARFWDGPLLGWPAFGMAQGRAVKKAQAQKQEAPFLFRKKMLTPHNMKYTTTKWPRTAKRNASFLFLWQDG